MLFHPCIFNDRIARINLKVAEPMTQADAENYLKTFYPSRWSKGEAIPQPISMFEDETPAFSEDVLKNFLTNTDKKYVGVHPREQEFIGKFPWKNQDANFSGNGIHPIVYVHRTGNVALGNWGNWSRKQDVDNTYFMTDEDIVDILRLIYKANRLESFLLHLNSCDIYVRNLWGKFGNI